MFIHKKAANYKNSQHSLHDQLYRAKAGFIAILGFLILIFELIPVIGLFL